MRVIFRTDASFQIGTGHVLRCLTLADAMNQRGVDCHFICREHPGHLIELIGSKGYTVHALPHRSEDQVYHRSGPVHAAWLGTSQEQDVSDCAPILRKLQPEWLIADHYSLDICWELPLRPLCRRLMIIDDLADRQHCCDLLLDQNLGRQVTEYNGLVPAECTLLVGPKYALLRPEFTALRKNSIERRKQAKLQNLLITMGGVDQPNASGKVLEALKQSQLSDDTRISVVMGINSPWLKQVREIAADMPQTTEVVVNVADMAQRMAECDLIIGAAGSTSWERCCLGVPTLIVVLADNQWQSAQALHNSHAAQLLGDISAISQISKALTSFKEEGKLEKMSKMSAQITDGQGCTRVVESLIEQFSG